MLRSGDIELRVSAGTFRSAGWLAVDWSSRAADAAGAYRLVVYSTVYPSGDTTNNRYNGLPLRWGGRGAVPIFGKNMHFLGKYAIIKVF